MWPKARVFFSGYVDFFEYLSISIGMCCPLPRLLSQAHRVIMGWNPLRVALRWGQKVSNPESYDYRYHEVLWTTKSTLWRRFEIDISMPTKWECKIKEAEEDHPLSNLEKERLKAVKRRNWKSENQMQKYFSVKKCETNKTKTKKKRGGFFFKIFNNILEIVLVWSKEQNI